MCGYGKCACQAGYSVAPNGRCTAPTEEVGTETPVVTKAPITEAQGTPVPTEAVTTPEPAINVTVSSNIDTSGRF